MSQKINDVEVSVFEAHHNLHVNSVKRFQLSQCCDQKRSFVD